MARIASARPTEAGVRQRIRDHIASSQLIGDPDLDRVAALDRGEDVDVPAWDVPYGIDLPDPTAAVVTVVGDGLRARGRAQ